MKLLLQPSTRPYNATITRAHSPQSARYSSFKECLRWEFGFTCAICLLHEVHLVLPGTGIASSGQMTIEHIVLKSTPNGAPLTDIYANCLLVCCFCNKKRNSRYLHIQPNGTRLLNPVHDIWSEHFELVGDKLEPQAGDAHAAYTRDAYDINDSVRLIRREKFRIKIHRLLVRIHARNAEIFAIDERLRAGNMNALEVNEVRSERGRKRKELVEDLDELHEFAGIPVDKPIQCKCSTTISSVPQAVSAGWQASPITRIPDDPSARPKRVRI